MYTVIDAAGRTLTLKDDEPCPPGYTLRTSLQFMDSVQRSVCDARGAGAAATPAGAYFKLDGCGRIAGICDEAAEARRINAAEDSAYRRYVVPRLAPMRDGKPNPWRFYHDWLSTHGNM
jgi:hypothetical protein